MRTMSWPSVACGSSMGCMIMGRTRKEPAWIASDAAMCGVLRARDPGGLRPRLAPRGREFRPDGVPVDDVPPRLEVVGTPVLVVEVVGVLPDVDAEDRRLAVHHRRVLVGRGLHGQAGAVPDEPRPAGAETPDAGVVS